jgi:hypothetical protein
MPLYKNTSLSQTAFLTHYARLKRLNLGQKILILQPPNKASTSLFNQTSFGRLDERAGELKCRKLHSRG